jgi:DNA-binding IclR family transcriptional regulator
MCVAAPILAGDGKVLGAVSVTFPAYINADRGIDKEIAAVTRCTAAIASRLTAAAG